MAELALLSLVVGVAAGTAPKPHLMYVLADDFGHHDIGFNGGDQPTPVLDALVGAFPSAMLARPATAYRRPRIDRDALFSWATSVPPCGPQCLAPRFAARRLLTFGCSEPPLM